MPDVSNIDIIYSGSYSYYVGAGQLGWQITDNRVTLMAFATGSWGEAAPYSPPTIENVLPTPGTSIGRTQSMEFDALDTESFRRIVVQVSFDGTIIQEVIHDGNSFGLAYQGPSNVRTVIPGGYHYVALRDGGWIGSPTLVPFAIDANGAENI